MVKTLGQQIRELRKEKDLSLREFAKKLGGLSAAFLSDVELGRRHPSDKVLTRMARVLGTSPDELRKYDTRAPLDELRHLAASDPAYGIAFRRLVDERIPPDALMRLANEEKRRGKKKPKK